MNGLESGLLRASGVGNFKFLVSNLDKYRSVVILANRIIVEIDITGDILRRTQAP